MIKKSGGSPIGSFYEGVEMAYQPLNAMSDSVLRGQEPERESDAFTKSSAVERVEELESGVGETIQEGKSSRVSPDSREALRRDSVACRIVDALLERGVTKFFGIPGGPICPLFEALRQADAAELVEVRHESHAAFAAASYFRLTGKVAAVVVTAGPGITNAVTGVASAFLEGASMVVLSGDVAWATHGGRLLQNSGPEGLNVENLLAPITRTQLRVTNAASAVSQTLAVYDAATDPIAGGPALLVLPIDKATEPARFVPIPAPLRRPALKAAQGTVREAAEWLSKAERPLLVLGGACVCVPEIIRQIVDVLDVPFVTTPRAKGVVSEDHPRSLRNGGMAASLWAKSYTVEGVDVALVLGSDLDDVSIGATPYIKRGGKLIHVDVNPQVFNRNLPTSLGITADLESFCQELYEVVLEEGLWNGRGRELMAKVKSLAAYDVPEFFSDASEVIPSHRAVADLQRCLPGARFITDIGEHMLFALHYLRAEIPGMFHIQLGLGSMGSGIAGATGLALADPTTPVVCICGDGGMQMSGMEILTSLKMRLPIIYAVMNDARYNMVHHGMRQIFGEASDYETPLVDFEAWGEAMGVTSRTIRHGGEMNPETMAELRREGGPILLDIRIDREIRVQSGGRVEALKHMSMLSDNSGQAGAV
ncbi:MAG: thiamine pyrophosphate-binding protein [Polyangiaceae bacterium]|nr:thiamine pyrophosphate-binding protein [Polyangiaceae bacterium]